MRSVFHTDSTSCVGYSNSRLEAAGKVGSLSLMTEETSMLDQVFETFSLSK